PELTFYVDDKAVTARDALVAITGGGRGGGSGGSAEQQIASAAIGMTTGLLTLGARREFGDWVPMLAIEQGDNTRVRVGVEADRFIPKFLSGFVRGAYVEGIVASQSTNSTQQMQRRKREKQVATGADQQRGVDAKHHRRAEGQAARADTTRTVDSPEPRPEHRAVVLRERIGAEPAQLHALAQAQAERKAEPQAERGRSDQQQADEDPRQGAGPF